MWGEFGGSQRSGGSGWLLDCGVFDGRQECRLGGIEWNYFQGGFGWSSLGLWWRWEVVGSFLTLRCVRV